MELQPLKSEYYHYRINSSTVYNIIKIIAQRRGATIPSNEITTVNLRRNLFNVVNLLAWFNFKICLIESNIV